jgi:hypothetical protein
MPDKDQRTAAGADEAGGNLTEGFAALQAWFAEAVRKPIPLDFEGNPLAAAAPGLREAGDALLRGSGGLSGFERLGVYNKQYWYRLLSVMQSDYSCAIHLMGLRTYNGWAIRYLADHPPSSPYLSRLDEGWPGYVEAHYRGADREAVVQALKFDRAFSRAFDAPEGRPPDPEVDPMALRLRLAPHVTVLALDWDFPAFRARCLADGSLEERIPLEPWEDAESGGGTRRMAVWRGRDLALWQKPVSPAAAKALGALAEPATLDEAFGRLEGDLTEGEEAELEANLAGWFGEWTRDGWIVTAE